MKGFGHLIWSAVGYNIAIAILTVVLLTFKRIEIIIGAVAISALAVIIQMISARMQKKKKSRKIYMGLRKLSLVALSISSLMMMAFHLGLNYNGLPHFNGVFLFIGLYLSMFGAYLPDADTKMLGIGHHRDPTTHSALLGGVIAFLLIFLTDQTYAPILIVFCGLTIGIAMHLLCDLIPHGSMGWKAIKSVFVWKKTPGNVVGIKEKYEQLYLFMNASILIYFSVLLAIRSLTEKLHFPSIIRDAQVTFTPLSLPLFIISISLICIPSALQIFFKSK